LQKHQEKKASKEINKIIEKVQQQEKNLKQKIISVHLPEFLAKVEQYIA
jgi:hypothetical protein